jgi:hypothetical protein
MVGFFLVPRELPLVEESFGRAIAGTVMGVKPASAICPKAQP